MADSIFEGAGQVVREIQDLRWHAARERIEAFGRTMFNRGYTQGEQETFDLLLRAAQRDAVTVEPTDEFGPLVDGLAEGLHRSEDGRSIHGGPDGVECPWCAPAAVPQADGFPEACS